MFHVKAEIVLRQSSGEPRFRRIALALRMRQTADDFRATTLRPWANGDSGLNQGGAIFHHAQSQSRTLRALRRKPAPVVLHSQNNSAPIRARRGRAIANRSTSRLPRASPPRAWSTPASAAGRISMPSAPWRAVRRDTQELAAPAVCRSSRASCGGFAWTMGSSPLTT